MSHPTHTTTGNGTLREQRVSGPGAPELTTQPCVALQIVTDQQTGQKIQIVTAVDASGSSKQQFLLTSPDGAGPGKVILASPETPSAKQLIFTTSDSLVPGRIQVRPCSSVSACLDLSWWPLLSLEALGS